MADWCDVQTGFADYWQDSAGGAVHLRVHNGRCDCDACWSPVQDEPVPSVVAREKPVSSSAARIRELARSALYAGEKLDPAIVLSAMESGS